MRSIPDQITIGVPFRFLVLAESALFPAPATPETPPTQFSCAIASTYGTVVLAGQLILTKALPLSEVEAMLMGACPHVPAVFTSTLTCTNNNTKTDIKTTSTPMRALPAARIDTSIPDPGIDARQARVTLRVVLENTIFDRRSEGISCVFTNTSALSPATEGALIETVWLDGQQHPRRCNPRKTVLYWRTWRSSLPCRGHDRTQHQDSGPAIQHRIELLLPQQWSASFVLPIVAMR